MLVYWNKRLINVENKEDYQFFDRAFHFGDGIYETIAVKNSKPVFLEEHIERLIYNAVRLNIPIDGTTDWKKYIDEIIKVDGIINGFIKAIITRGTMNNSGLSYPKPIEPSVFTWGQKCQFTSLKIKQPYKILISKTEKRNPYSIVTYTKTLNYLSNIIAKHEADEAGYDETILLNTYGKLTEATTANLFLIDNNGKISTPEEESGLLNGVVRGKVIEIAAKLGLEVEETTLSPEKLSTAKGCFLTSSLIDITPVIEIKDTAKYNLDDFIQILEDIDNIYQTLK